MSGHLTDTLLHDHLDGELEPAERREAQAHLDVCAECAGRLADLAELVGALGALPEEAVPARDLWAGIDARIDGADADVVELPVRHRGPQPNRVSLSWTQLVAAGITVALVSAALLWSVLGGTPDPVRSPVASAGTTLSPAVQVANDRYEQAIFELEQVVEQGRGVLSPQTVETLQTSLDAIDDALGEARAALAEDPGSELLNRLIIDHQQAKLRVLQRAAAAIQL